MRPLALLLLLVGCVDPDTIDADGDGYPGANDCDDDDPEIHPNATEYCDGVDTDCDGDVDEPQAIDADAWYVDADDDGFGDPDRVAKACGEPVGFSLSPTDCDDDDDTVHPDAEEEPGDGIDNDCDPSTPD